MAKNYNTWHFPNPDILSARMTGFWDFWLLVKGPFESLDDNRLPFFVTLPSDLGGPSSLIISSVQQPNTLFNPFGSFT